MVEEQHDTKWKKHIGNFLLEYDHYVALIKISYEGDLLKAYDAKVNEAETKFDYYKKELQRIVDKKKNE